MPTNSLEQFALTIAQRTNFPEIAELLAEALRAQWEQQQPTEPLLRLLIHIRNAHGYSNLHCHSWLGEANASIDLTPSTRLWTLLEEKQQPAILDLVLDSVFLAESGNLTRLDLETGELSQGTTERFRSRETTHVLAWPLCDPQGKTAGMVCLELGFPLAIGLAETLAGFLQNTVDHMTLSALPLLATRPAETPGPVSPYLELFALQQEALLLTGATGTGKSRLARKIHAQSTQSAGPFVTFSIIGLSAEMQLAHLFGWKQGAFTGATQANPGMVNGATDGSLFIDEVDKLSADAQAGLLGLLEEQHYLRLGEQNLRQASNVRILAASNADLKTLVAAGEFREDLYFRLHVFPIHLPSLDDVPQHFAFWVSEVLADITSKPNGTGKVAQLDPDALQCLAANSWPGNLRQLSNVLRRALVFHGTHNSLISFEAVRKALLLEQNTTLQTAPAAPAGDLIASLRFAAEQLLELNNNNPEVFSKVLDLSKTNVLVGALWYAAIEQYSADHNEVASILGKETALQSRNYKKEMRRELAKLAQLYQALDQPVPENLKKLLA